MLHPGDAGGYSSCGAVGQAASGQRALELLVEAERWQDVRIFAGFWLLEVLRDGKAIGSWRGRQDRVDISREPLAFTAATSNRGARAVGCAGKISQAMTLVGFFTTLET